MSRCFSITYNRGKVTTKLELFKEKNGIFWRSAEITPALGDSK